MCKQCARGGCANYFRNRGAPTNRALASACSPAPTTPTILNLGLATPLKGGFLALCFPLQLCRKCAFHSKTELKWITVGLWVLAACAGRSTRSKGSQQTLRLSHPVRVARKQGKERLFAFQAEETGRAGSSDRRFRVFGICQPGVPPGGLGPQASRFQGPGVSEGATLPIFNAHFWQFWGLENTPSRVWAPDRASRAGLPPPSPAG